MSTDDTIPIYTIGHANRTPNELIDLLCRRQIAYLIDVRTLAEQDPSFVLFLVLGSIGVSVGYLRGLWALLDADYDDESYVKTIVQDAQEPRLLLIIIVILMLVCIVTGLFPSLLIDPLRETALRVPLLIQ